MERRSEQLEQEAEDARAQLADTMEEFWNRVDDLRHRMSPANLLSSPFTVTLIGAGAAWFLLRRIFGESKETEPWEHAKPIAEKAGAFAKRAIPGVRADESAALPEQWQASRCVGRRGGMTDSRWRG